MRIRRDTLKLVEQLLNEVELDTDSLDLQIDKYLQTYEQASQKNADQLTLSECFSLLLLEDEADELIDKLAGGTDEKSDDKKDNSNKKSSGKEKDKELDFDINLDEPAADSEQEEPTSKKSDDADSGEEVPQEQPTTDIAGDELAQPENDTATTDVAEPEQPVQKQRPGQIDVSVFASKVSNLVNNIENLLDIKSVIINRAHKIITTNYGEKDAKEFKQALASKHKMKTADAYDKPY